MEQSWRAELRELAASARALLAWEEELGVEQVPVEEVPTERAPVEGAPIEGAPAEPTSGPPPAMVRPPREEAARRLEVLAERAATCTQCALHRGRTNSVFARGDVGADLVFIGEGPGYHEDQRGLPFVGRAGQLLDRMIAAMGYTPDQVYICNVVKCRPPDNRTPLPDEAAACLPYLEAQLETVAPQVMVALGRTAAQHLGCIQPEQRGWRGKWYRWRGVPVMATYHPAFLLRNPENKRPVWEDLQQVMRALGRTPPATTGRRPPTR